MEVGLVDCKWEGLVVDCNSAGLEVELLVDCNWQGPEVLG